MQHTAISHDCKNDNFQLIFFLTIFICFCSKHRLCVQTHNQCFRAKTKKHNKKQKQKNKQTKKTNKVYPCKPQFYYIKVGVRGSTSLVSMMFCGVKLILSHTMAELYHVRPTKKTINLLISSAFPARTKKTYRVPTFYLITRYISDHAGSVVGV